MTISFLRPAENAQRNIYIYIYVYVFVNLVAIMCAVDLNLSDQCET